MFPFITWRHKNTNIFVEISVFYAGQAPLEFHSSAPGLDIQLIFLSLCFQKPPLIELSLIPSVLCNRLNIDFRKLLRKIVLDYLIEI